METPIISGTGLFIPKDSISNDELVQAFNQYVHNFNKDHSKEISEGKLTALEESSAAFIVKASGIGSRYVLDRKGILDPKIMKPQLPARKNEDISYQCEMAVHAAKEALAAAQKSVEEVDGVILACSNFERPYPALSVEVQHALGMKRGFAFDMNVACSSATFGISVASDLIRGNNAQTILVISPEICSAHLDFRDRDSHFIFGDACTAVVLEDDAGAGAGKNTSGTGTFKILGTKLATQYSNNIRNNFGFLNRTHPTCEEDRNCPGILDDKLFKQNGRKVFKEVIPLVAHHIQDHLKILKIDPSQIKRFWLHQANLSMNHLIGEKILGRELSDLEAPNILQEFANTSSAGSIIAFHQYHKDLKKGDLGIICSFGAGYSVGSVVLEKL